MEIEQQKTLQERKNELLENLLIDGARIDQAYRNRDMNFAGDAKDFDYYLGELQKLEPEKSCISLMNEILKYKIMKEGN